MPADISRVLVTADSADEALGVVTRVVYGLSFAFGSQPDVVPLHLASPDSALNWVVEAYGLRSLVVPRELDSRQVYMVSVTLEDTMPNR